jgi:hypothetical protein
MVYRGEIEMDSSVNHRHSQVHAADLQRRAELHRQVAVARATRRAERPVRHSLLAPPSLLEQVRVVAARLRHKTAATSGRAS